MDKEKVLAAAQKNKYMGKEYENKVSIRGGIWSSFVALLVGVFLCLLEYFCDGTLNIGLIAVGLTASGVEFLYEGIKVKKTLMMVAGTIEAIAAIFVILAFVGQVVLK